MVGNLSHGRPARSGWRLALLAPIAALAIAGPAAATTLSGDLTADNAFEAFLSTSPGTLGTAVASGNSWGNTYTLPATTLTPGKTYYLQIEAVDGGPPGAFIGSFSLSDTDFQFANGGQTLDTDTVNWTGGFNDSQTNLPQSWIQPTGGVVSDGSNGVGPWGYNSGIDSAAEWIWPADSQSGGTNACGNCTVDFMTTITSNVTGGVPEPAEWALMLVGVLGVGAAMRRRRTSGLAEAAELPW